MIRETVEGIAAMVEVIRETLGGICRPGRCSTVVSGLGFFAVYAAQNDTVNDPPRRAEARPTFISAGISDSPSFHGADEGRASARHREGAIGVAGMGNADGAMLHAQEMRTSSANAE